MKEDGNNTHQKACWMIGFALIIFLVILGGSLIVMKMVRQKAGEIGNASVNGSKVQGENYMLGEDGSKINNSKGVTQAEIDLDGVKFSNFAVRESKDIFASGDDTAIVTDIDIDIQNLSEKDIINKFYIIEFYDSADTLMTEFSIKLEKLEAGKFTSVRQSLDTECVNAKRVSVRSVTLGLDTDVSGE